MRQWLIKHNKMIWYTMCFALLGLIDQRCGSAVGEVQMIFRNCTGIVIAFMLLPSLQLSKFREKIYLIWTPICLLLTVVACVEGVRYWAYAGQWISGVLNLTVWSYLLIYLVKEWQNIDGVKRIKQPFFLCIVTLWILMQLSVREGIEPLWYLLIFGGFYLIGIEKESQNDFFQGMLNGIILWFFVQQSIAFGFRPYDYVRYSGLYSGETQNGLFYMLVFCAFMLKWWLAKKNKYNKWLKLFYFLMSASCVGFIILTGGRSSLAGAIVISLFVYTVYYICHKKSFYAWLGRGMALVLCIILMFPVVYVSVRYLPTILHHPIWFEGEYNAETSVHSFDSWYSERYISFEEVLDTTVFRFFQLFGVDYETTRDKGLSSIDTLKAYAAERIEPGDTTENPYTVEGVVAGNAITDRIVIYHYFWKHLNWSGHTSAESGFYISYWEYMYHAHNMFLQIAYDYGILPGIMFAGICIYSIFGFLKRHRTEDLICLTMLIAIICFGMFEMAVEPGQIIWTLTWLIFGFTEDNRIIIKRE